jgi:hypothetical protein
MADADEHHCRAAQGIYGQQPAAGARVALLWRVTGLWGKHRNLGSSEFQSSASARLRAQARRRVRFDASGRDGGADVVVDMGARGTDGALCTETSCTIIEVDPDHGCYPAITVPMPKDVSKLAE